MTRAIATLAVLATVLAACATAGSRDLSRASAPVATDGPHFGSAVTGGSVRGPG